MTPAIDPREHAPLFAHATLLRQVMGSATAFIRCMATANESGAARAAALLQDAREAASSVRAASQAGPALASLIEAQHDLMSGAASIAETNRARTVAAILPRLVPLVECADGALRAYVAFVLGFELPTTARVELGRALVPIWEARAKTAFHADAARATLATLELEPESEVAARWLIMALEELAREAQEAAVELASRVALAEASYPHV